MMAESFSTLMVMSLLIGGYSATPAFEYWITHWPTFRPLIVKSLGNSVRETEQIVGVVLLTVSFVPSTSILDISEISKPTSVFCVKRNALVLTPSPA